MFDERLRDIHPQEIGCNTVLTLAPKIVNYETDQKKEKGPQHDSQCDFNYHAILPIQEKGLLRASFIGRFYLTQKIEELGFCREDQCVFLR